MLSSLKCLELLLFKQYKTKSIKLNFLFSHLTTHKPDLCYKLHGMPVLVLEGIMS